MAVFLFRLFKVFENVMSGSVFYQLIIGALFISTAIFELELVPLSIIEIKLSVRINFLIHFGTGDEVDQLQHIHLAVGGAN